MIRIRLYIVLFSAAAFFVSSTAFPQFRNSNNKNYLPLKGWSFSVSGNYVSSALIELNPFSSDYFERNQKTELEGGYGFGLSVKKRILGKDLWLGMSAEYVKITDDQLFQYLENDSNFVKVRVTETIEVIPAEFTFYFNVPTGTDMFNLYLGGGLGIYFGDRIKQMLGYKSTTIGRNNFLNIVVLSGFEFFPERNFSFFLEARFRQGKYEVQSTFPINQVTLEGTTYPVQDKMNSRIFLDGVKVALGISYHL